MEKLKSAAWWIVKALFWLVLVLYAISKYEDMSSVERLIIGGFVAIGVMAWQLAKASTERDRQDTARWEALSRQLSQIENEVALIRIERSIGR